MDNSTATPDPQSATPSGSTPSGATPTTSTGATPAKMSLEEALAKIADLERHATNKSEEASRHGKNLSAAEKKLAAYEEKERLAQEAALTEAEKLNKRASEAEKLAAQFKQQLVTAHVKLAAQAKGIIDPDVAAMAIEKSLEYGEDGMPSNLEKALDDLIKSKPYLAPPKPAETPAEPAPPSPAQTANATRPPAIPAMQPGRTNIAPPNATQPGKIPTWNDIYRRS